jgi:hypothetical protein
MRGEETYWLGIEQLGPQVWQQRRRDDVKEEGLHYIYTRIYMYIYIHTHTYIYIYICTKGRIGEGGR